MPTREKEAWLNIEQVAPRECWPETVAALLYPETLRRAERFKLVTFLYGNGANVADIKAALAPKLRDQSAVRHVKDILEQYETMRIRHECDYQRFFYFDLRQNEMCTLNGVPRGHSSSACSKINSWDMYCNSSDTYPSLQQQDAFFAAAETDAFVFFNGMPRGLR